MTTLTTQIMNASTGLAPSMGAAAPGDKIVPGPTTFLMVSNGAGSPITVTIDIPGTNKWGQPNPDVVVTVTNGTTKLIGPLTKIFQGTDKLIALTWSSTTTVTRAAIRS